MFGNRACVCGSNRRSKRVEVANPIEYKLEHSGATRAVGGTHDTHHFLTIKGDRLHSFHLLALKQVSPRVLSSLSHGVLVRGSDLLLVALHAGCLSKVRQSVKVGTAVEQNYNLVKTRLRCGAPPPSM